ncbi:MAG: cache domain-containing protein [Desulfobacter sp.]
MEITPKKDSFIGRVRRSVIIALGVLAALLLGIHTLASYNDSRSRAGEMRADYIAAQRALIKQEVERVAYLIDHETEIHLKNAKARVEARVREAHAIALNIYHENAGARPVGEIKKLIIDALRPIRFDQGRGYYFINGFDGVAKLLADRPGQEGRNLIDARDTRGRYVVRDMISIIRTRQEGFYSYHWTKPDHQGNDFEKISFVKIFEPFGWFMGAGVYLDAVESSMHEIIARYVNTHRFGPGRQGYVFINELLDIRGGKAFARIYANPNRPGDTGKIISDDYRDAKGKMFRKAFLKGVRDHGECYVDYWYRKIDNPTPSPKTGFFKLAGNGRFIVAAGIYLDDVEHHILKMQQEETARLLNRLAVISVIFAAAMGMIVLVFNRLGQRFENDFQLFVAFFRRAADASQIIDRRQVRFSEFDLLAGYANQMLAKQSRIQNELRLERTHLKEVIAEQKETETALRKSEEEFRILIENASDAIYIIQDDKIKYCNPVTEKITGYRAEQLESITLDTLIHKDDRDAAAEQYRKNLSGQGTPAGYSFRMIRQDSKTIWAEASSVLIEWDNKPASLNFLRDVTEQKNLEKQLIHSQKMEAVGTLAGGIAHDFNNILFPLIGYAEMLKDDLPGKGPHQQRIRELLSAAMRARNLVKQILTFCRGRDHGVKPIRIQPILAEVLELLRASIPRTIDIRTEIDPACGRIVADPTQIHQVIMNLATNAYHAMKADGGRMCIHLVPAQIPPGHPSLSPGRYVHLSVEDSGSGIEKEILERIFDPYFTTKEKGDGTGLGLSVVQGIVKRCGGDIRVSSEPGRGTTFHIHIPMVEDTPLGASPKPSQTQKGNQEHILFVDDDTAIVKMAAQILERLGYRVTPETGSVAALETFKADPSGFDLILSDMTMPEMTGIQLAEQVKKIRSDIPFIICTGFSDQINAETSQNFNIQGYIAKPILTNEISRVLRDVLDKNA